jgi:hypothetical protein
MRPICGGCGLGCRKITGCSLFEAWAAGPVQAEVDDGTRATVQTLVNQARRGILIIGAGVDGAELLDWLRWATDRQWLWIWDRETCAEAAWAAEGGRYVHHSWVVECARTWILWGVTPDHYPPWSESLGPFPDDVVVAPALSGPAAWQWLMALRRTPNRDWSQAVVLYDPFELDDASVFLLHRWSNAAKGPHLFPLHPTPHRLGARRIVQEWSGTVWPTSAPHGIGAVPRADVTSWRRWEPDVLIEVQGVHNETAVGDPGDAAWIFVGPQNHAGARAWIPYRWARATGHWSFSDEGALATWDGPREPTVVRTWLL